MGHNYSIAQTSQFYASCISDVSAPINESNKSKILISIWDGNLNLVNLHQLHVVKELSRFSIFPTINSISR